MWRSSLTFGIDEAVGFCLRFFADCSIFAVQREVKFKLDTKQIGRIALFAGHTADFNLVRPRRFERPTPAFGGQYSIQLSYGRIGLSPVQGAGFYLLAASPSMPIRKRPCDSIEKCSCRLEALGVVAVIQAVDAHPPVTRWGMDEALVAQVDPDM